jgi:hypothetical protein
MILVELLNLTFDQELAAGGTQTSNSLHQPIAVAGPDGQTIGFTRFVNKVCASGC